jgi:hypothetical protein
MIILSVTAPILSRASDTLPLSPARPPRRDGEITLFARPPRAPVPDPTPPDIINLQVKSHRAKRVYAIFKLPIQLRSRVTRERKSEKSPKIKKEEENLEGVLANSLLPVWGCCKKLNKKECSTEATFLLLFASLNILSLIFILSRGKVTFAGQGHLFVNY